MIEQLVAPCWELGIDPDLRHFADRDVAEEEAAWRAVQDDEPPEWPRLADAPCWVVTCGCGEPLLTRWEEDDDEDCPDSPHWSSEAEALLVVRDMGGRCRACWNAALEPAS